jgi:hypothetical protein
MSLFRCRQCHTKVRRGRFCARCGASQPPRVLRALLAVVGAAALVLAGAAAFARIDGGAPEFTPPQPSNGKWAAESEFLPVAPDDEDWYNVPLLSTSTTPASTPGAEVASR